MLRYRRIKLSVEEGLPAQVAAHLEKDQLLRFDFPLNTVLNPATNHLLRRLCSPLHAVVVVPLQCSAMHLNNADLQNSDLQNSDYRRTASVFQRTANSRPALALLWMPCPCLLCVGIDRDCISRTPLSIAAMSCNATRALEETQTLYSP